jgi:hypothetical protein
MASRWHSIGADARRALTTPAAFDGPRVIITDEPEPPVWRMRTTGRVVAAMRQSISEYGQGLLLARRAL